MAKLYKFENVFSTDNDQYTLPEGQYLSEWMLNKWPEGFGSKVRVEVYNRAVRLENLIDPTEHIIKKGDLFLLVLMPGDPATAAIIITSAVVSYYIAKNSIPDFDTKRPESPNNLISGQKNTIRTNERIPDIVGKVRSYPDVRYPAVEEFTASGKQKITELFNIGIGSYDRENERNGDSLLSEDETTTVEYFDPVSEVTTLTDVTEFYKIESANGLSLRNGEQAPGISQDDVTYTLVTGSFDGSIDIAVDAGESSALYQSINAGDTLRIMATSDNSSNRGKMVYVKSKTPNPSAPAAGTEKLNIQCEETWVTTSQLDNQNFFIAPKAHAVLDSQVSFAPGYYGNNYVFEVFYNNSDDATKAENYHTRDTSTARRWMIVEAGGDPTDGNSGVYDLTIAPTHTASKSIFQVDNSGPAFTNAVTNDSDVYFTFLEPLIGPFTTPISDTEEIWLNIEFPNGIPEGQVMLEVVLEQLDGTDFKIIDGNDSVNPLVYKIVSSANYRVTEKLVLDDHGLSSGLYRIWIRKYFDSSNDTAETTLVSLAAVKTTPSFTIGNQTACKVTTEYYKTGPKADTRKFNVEVTRKLPDYMWFTDSPGDSRHGQWQVSGNARTTGGDVADQQWINAVMYRATASDGMELTADTTAIEVDVAGLQTIQNTLNALDSGEGGEFNYTFDSEMSADEELKLMAKAARCEVYRIGKKLYFSRDEQQDDITALFNRRNKSPKGETRHFDFDHSNRRDSVEITYQDAEDGYKAQTFTYPKSTDTQDYNATYNLGVNPIKAKLTGITNFSQAYRYAMYLYRVDKMQRDSITLETTDDSRVLSINDKILNADSLEYNDLDGEIVSYDDTTPSSTTITLDRPVYDGVADPLTVYRSIKLRTSDGQETLGFACLKGTTDYDVVIDNSVANFDLSVSDGVSRGTLYQFKLDGDTSLDEWIVKEISAAGNYSKVKAVKYNEDVYDCDTVTVPNRVTYLGS